MDGPGAIPLTWGEQPCFDLVNSRWRDHLDGAREYDRLDRAEWQAAFVGRWGWVLPVAAGPAPVELLAGLRSLLREALERLAAKGALTVAQEAGLNAFVGAVPLERRLQRGRLRVTPAVRDWDWVLAETAASVAAVVGAGPGRVKVCGNAACSWMFLDLTRNRSRRWCEARVCGSLVKVRRFRERGRAYAVASERLGEKSSIG